METYIVFSMDDFLNNPTVDYLSKCVLNHDTMGQILSMSEELDFPCVKYLIDFWVNGQCDWDDTFEDESSYTQIQLIHFACKYCCEQAVFCTFWTFMKKKIWIWNAEAVRYHIQ